MVSLGDCSWCRVSVVLKSAVECKGECKGVQLVQGVCRVSTVECKGECRGECK